MRQVDLEPNHMPFWLHFSPVRVAFAFLATVILVGWVVSEYRSDHWYVRGTRNSRHGLVGWCASVTTSGGDICMEIGWCDYNDAVSRLGSGIGSPSQFCARPMLIHTSERRDSWGSPLEQFACGFVTEHDLGPHYALLAPFIVVLAAVGLLAHPLRRRRVRWPLADAGFQVGDPQRRRD